MDQTDAIQDELTRDGRIAYRRLVRAGAPRSAQCSDTSGDLTDRIARTKRQLRVDLKLQRTAPWASRPLRTAALESRLAVLLRMQSLRAQQTQPRPAPTA